MKTIARGLLMVGLGLVGVGCAHGGKRFDALVKAVEVASGRMVEKGKEAKDRIVEAGKAVKDRIVEKGKEVGGQIVEGLEEINEAVGDHPVLSGIPVVGPAVAVGVERVKAARLDVEVDTIEGEAGAPIVVAVHGFEWKSQVSGGGIPANLEFGEELSNSAAFENAEIREVHWSGTTGDTERVIHAEDDGSDLVDVIETAVQHAREKGVRVALVGHSWGGVLLKLALAEADLEPGDIDLLVTFGSPLSGDQELHSIPGLAARFTAIRNAGLQISDLPANPDSVNEWINYWRTDDNVSGEVPAGPGVTNIEIKREWSGSDHYAADYLDAMVDPSKLEDRKAGQTALDTIQRVTSEVPPVTIDQSVAQGTRSLQDAIDFQVLSVMESRLAPFPSTTVAGSTSPYPDRTGMPGSRWAFAHTAAGPDAARSTVTATPAAMPTVASFTERFQGTGRSVADGPADLTSTITFSNLTGDRTGVLPGSLAPSMSGRAFANPTLVNPDTGPVPVAARINGSGILINGQPVKAQSTMTFTRGFSDFRLAEGPFTIRPDGSSSGSFAGVTVNPLTGQPGGVNVTIDYSATPR